MTDSLFTPEDLEKDVVPVKQKDEQDPDLQLKKQMKAEFPKMDGLMIDIALRIHRDMVFKHGEDYDTELLEKEILCHTIGNVSTSST